MPPHATEGEAMKFLENPFQTAGVGFALTVVLVSIWLALR